VIHEAGVRQFCGHVDGGLCHARITGCLDGAFKVRRRASENLAYRPSDAVGDRRAGNHQSKSWIRYYYASSRVEYSQANGRDVEYFS
jgi:hypothetical protein